MTVEEIRKLSDEELDVKLIKVQDELSSKKLEVLNGTQKDTSIINKLQRETARLLTIKNERKKL